MTWKKMEKRKYVCDHCHKCFAVNQKVGALRLLRCILCFRVGIVEVERG